MLPICCYWCASTQDVTVYANGFDDDPLRDAEPPTLALCAGCLPPESSKTSIVIERYSVRTAAVRP